MKKNKEHFPPGFFSDWAINDMDLNRPADEKPNGEPEVTRDEEEDFYKSEDPRGQ